MLVVLPPLCFGLLVCLAYLTTGRNAVRQRAGFATAAEDGPGHPPRLPFQTPSQDGDLPDGRRCFLTAAVIWGVLLVAMTESLSAIDSLTHGWVLACWAVACALALVLCVRLLRIGGRPALVPRLPSTPSGAAWWIGAVALIVLIIGVIALVAPPNDSDSMKYHMMRVVHWMQDGSVAPYPSEYLPQLYDPPWAEFAILHLQILSGGDHFANLVQWWSMVGTIVGVSSIAQQLGADGRGQLLAAVTAATIPAGIVQASTAQNADVVAFWLVCSVYFLLSLYARFSWMDALLLGASLGLALLTKGTAYVFLVPFGLWFASWGIKTLRWGVWKPALFLVLVALSLNIAQYASNITLFHNPLGPEDALYANQVYAPSAFVSNLVRNLSLHLGTPGSHLNAFLERTIYDAHSVIGIDANDPRTTWRNHQFHINPMSTHESTAGNLAHLGLILLASVFLVFLIFRRQSVEPVDVQYPGIVPYFATAWGGFLLFCLLFKWQPWNSRLHLPFFVLFAPLCGIVLTRLSRAKLGSALAAVLLLASLPWVVDNQSRPLWGSRSIFSAPRFDQYFTNLAIRKSSYAGAAQLARSSGCSQVGFDWGDVRYRLEYPLWIALEAAGRHGVRVEDVNVDNGSAVVALDPPFSTFRPCAIVGVALGGRSQIEDQGHVYRRTWSSGVVGVFEP